MDPALGPPEKMEQRRDDLTPMLSQYDELARAYDDCLLLFQVGDFYEAFCEAAETIARLLEITLTSRSDSTGTYAMAGIPIDNAESYIDTLLDAGYRVAIADQVEDPDAVSGVVERAVTRIITPGMVTETELLAGDANNFVACLVHEEDTYGLAILDVSTGEFVATGLSSWSLLVDELARFDPAELITNDPALADDLEYAVSRYPPAFDPDYARGRVAAYFGDPQTMLAHPAEVRACGALLAYAEYTRGGRPAADATAAEAVADATQDPAAPPQLAYITQLQRYDPREYMLLDAVAARSLELFERRGVRGAEDATLEAIVDATVTAMGSRRLTDWLRRPLREPTRISHRHDAVEGLVDAVSARETIQEALENVYDIERLAARIARGRADARDLRSLATTLAVVPTLRETLDALDHDALSAVATDLDPLTDVRTAIEEALRSDPPQELTEGGLIKDGYDETLDQLRETERSGKAWIEELEASERERTGIDSLKVGSNDVHGYYIEVTNANLDRVPEDYQRRQTLKNAERYITPELKDRETEIVRAEQRADEREYDLFCDLRSTIAEEVRRLQALADAIARLDALAGLATTAAIREYVRPEILDTDEAPPRIDIEAGRHPIVEARQDAFVPNDTTLEAGRRLAVITGPNMSGKSTYMRQVALIVILAQAGSFVPASAARLTPLERVFTRVGANDDIAGGRSTFMIEMLELAEILRAADERSLVLLDEVGRGTSTADGLAIARAITEYIHDRLGALTLFATHHHDLTKTADQLAEAYNLHFAATQDGSTVEFSHEIAPGAAEASYGVEVAREAGLPPTVVERARTLLDESDEVPPTAVSDDAASTIERRLRELDLASMTPLEALNELATLQDHLEP